MNKVKTKPLLSIIIPVYNAEKYIERCLDSILVQDQKNYEIICVNDASRDNSLKILKNYEKKFDYIKVLNSKINRKAGPSRMAGLKASKGEYVWFVDVDDKVTTKSLKIILSKLTKKSDLLVFNYFVIDKKENFSKKRIKSKNYLQQLILQTTSSTLWNKIFHKDILEGVDMNDQIGEDTEFLLNVLVKTKEILFFPEGIYIYGLNDSSITINYNKYNLEGTYNNIQNLKKFLILKNLYSKYKKDYLTLKFKKYGYLLRKCWNSKEIFKQKIKEKILMDEETNFGNFLNIFHKLPKLDLFFWGSYFINKNFVFKLLKIKDKNE